MLINALLVSKRSHFIDMDENYCMIIPRKGARHPDLIFEIFGVAPPPLKLPCCNLSETLQQEIIVFLYCATPFSTKVFLFPTPKQPNL